MGYYKTTDLVDADMPGRPDTMYGVSKCFGESLSRYCYDRLDIETVCLRIGSSFPEPANRRMIVTWFRFHDMVELLRCPLFAPRVGHTMHLACPTIQPNGGTTARPAISVSRRATAPPHSRSAFA